MTNNITKHGRIKKEIRRINRAHDRILYKISAVILCLIAVFIFVCSILQIDGFNSHFPKMPVLPWICQQEYIGVFFIPFLFLLSTVCQFVMMGSKPITIHTLITTVSSLQENELITKESADTITQIAEKEKKELAYRRHEQLKKQLAENEKLNELKKERKQL